MSVDDPWSYIPPLSLWQLVMQNVSLSEQNEIKSMLGESLVDTSLELHEEVNMLLEIWRDYSDEAELENQNQHKLAEPPYMRDLLIQEISFLAENIREKSLRRGMGPSALLSKHKTEILEYAEESKRSGTMTSRPQSARTADGQLTPLSPTDQISSRASLSSAITEEVASVSNKFNYMQFEDVCSRLRETLTKEVEQLQADVSFLQDCLDNAADCRSQGVSPALSREPTIAELREERSLLEKDLLSTESLPKAPAVSRPSFQPTAGHSSMKNWSPLSSRLRLVNASSGRALDIPRAKPLKASHHLIQNTSPVTSPDYSSCGTSKPDSLLDKGITPRTLDDDEDYDYDDDDDDSNKEKQSHLGDGETMSADGRLSQASDSANRAITLKTYDFGLTASPPTARKLPSPIASPSKQSSHLVSSRTDFYKSQEHKTAAVLSSGTKDSIRRLEAAGMQRHRTISPARVKVVSVNSIHDPQAGATSGRSFMPTPPPSDKPHLARPNSAERFRKMVMQYRETM